MVVRTSGFLPALFAPEPEVLQKKQQQDLLAHVAGYVDSASGAWDLFAVIDRALVHLKRAFSLSVPSLTLVNRAINTINTLGITLSIPALIVDVNTLRISLSRWIHHHRDLRAATSCFLNTMSLINTASQAAWIIDSLKWVSFKAIHVRMLNGIYYLTSGIVDSFELVGECLKLRYNPLTKEHRSLAWMKVAKDISSIAITVIALVGIFVYGFSQLPVIAFLWLTLNTFWLVMKIICHFYEKLRVERTT